jgi:hypothetical protein
MGCYEYSVGIRMKGGEELIEKALDFFQKSIETIEGEAESVVGGKLVQENQRPSYRLTSYRGG